MPTDAAPPGVTPIDHTADVGVEVEAPDLPQLFARAALGMAWLIHGGDRPGDARPSAGIGDGGGAVTTHDVELSADDLPSLLREWLRELLYRHETEGLSLNDVRFETLDETRLVAAATLAPDKHAPIREIKGVTLHGLTAERRGGTWVGRVIFDV